CLVIPSSCSVYLKCSQSLVLCPLLYVILNDQNFFSADPLEKQYVYLQAQFPSVTLEKVVLLSFQSGYIFVQTDKPIYTPASTECINELSNISLTSFCLLLNCCFYQGFFYVRDASLTVDIEAKYLFGQKVDGNAFVVFGVMEDEKKTSIPASLQKVQIVKGEGTAELTSQMITETFPNINQLVGRSIYVSVSLLTESGSEMVEAERRGIQIVTSPYTIHFKKTPHFFKPGILRRSWEYSNCNKCFSDPREINDLFLLKLKTDDEDDDYYYTDSEEIVSRTQFPESMIWEEIDLPTCRENHWILSCAKTEIYPIITHFMLDLFWVKFPLDIEAVRVEFMETEDVCSSASKKGKYRTTVSVDKGSSIAVSYVIIPMTLGNHVIEVKASAYDFSDGVRKPLKVVSEGVLIPLQRENVELNPVKNGENPLVFKADIPADRLPDTPAVTYISITAEEIAQTFEQAISGSFMGQFIVQPRSNGEQNMMLMILPLIATHYLDSTNQWDTVGMERRNEAVNHISTGYQQQLVYRKSDGSYAAWIHIPSSTWLTAYVAKVFSMATNLVTIDDNVICSALKWLIHHKQLPEGSFKEESAVIHREMVNYRGSDAGVLLVKMMPPSWRSVFSLHESIRKAVSFLEGRLLQLTNLYAVALTSYAMASANKLNEDILMKHSSQHEAGRSWNVSGQHHHSLEATAYAVLALVKDKDFDKAGEAVHWLNRQQSHYGGSGTTQATIMVFQAVAEYRTQVKDRQNFNLDVELSVAGRSKTLRYTIKRENAHLTRSDRVDINQEFNVTAKGTGTATLSVLTLYYARPVEKKSDCTFFDLTVKMEKDNEAKQGAVASYKLTMDFYYKDDKTDATMTILDIGLPTGFEVEESDLKQLSSGKERYIQKYEKNKVLSERGSLILYLNKVSHKEKEVISFRMHQMLNVGLLQPAAVTIYEYYSPVARCTKFYHPERKDGAIYRLCKGDLCQCAEENCSYQKKNQVSDEERLNKACEAGMDYVYKVTVVGMDLKQDSDIYDMKVEQVLREGTDGDAAGKVKPFLTRPGCREYLGLVKGKSYLIMGRSVDLTMLGGSLQYVFGEQTWVEYWPTREESPTPEHRERYIGITELKNSLLNYGCAT
uniref:NTR domain-containing protein n=1 Tax=Sinocyclocheilus rhinocerous TaxID=307959 RepID=A0A673L9Z4_9TELE